MSLSTHPHIGRRLVIAIAATGMLAYLAGGIAIDTHGVVRAVRQLGWIGCSAIIALSITNYLIRYQRWEIFLVRLGHHLPAAIHLLYYLSGFAFTISPAKAGEAMRSLYLREHGVTYADSIAALFVERLLDLLAMALLASLLAVSEIGYRPLIVGVLLLVCGVIAIVGRPSLPRLLRRFQEWVRHPWLTRVLAGSIELLTSSRLILRPKFLVIGTLAGVLSWGGEGLGYFLICHGLGISIGAGLAIGIYALAILAGTATFFLPAGIGGMEVVMTTLLVAHGAPLRVALVATLLCRVATLWLAVLMGIGATLLAETANKPACTTSTP